MGNLYFIVGLVAFLISWGLFIWVASEEETTDAIRIILIGFLASLLAGIFWVFVLFVLLLLFLFKKIRKGKRR